MTREEIEKCWRDPRNRKWGIFYYCKADPRVIVPKRLKWMGWTVNAAHAVGLSDERGRVAVGLPANLVVWNCRDVRELAYWYGMPLAWRVYASGRPCHGQGRPR